MQITPAILAQGENNVINILLQILHEDTLLHDIRYHRVHFKSVL